MPQTVAYCHCTGCHRLSGAPVSAFAAFQNNAVTVSPAPRPAAPVSSRVTRWFCDGCGAAIAATYDYLPDQTYTPVGLWDQAENLRPSLHSHAASALSWHHLQDDLPRNGASARAALLETLE